jgi:hypothetical protein
MAGKRKGKMPATRGTGWTNAGLQAELDRARRGDTRGVSGNVVAAVRGKPKTGHKR